jgi:hypothetical protein
VDLRAQIDPNTVVRNCQTETAPRVEKKDLLEANCWAVSWVQSAASQVDWVVGFIGGTNHQSGEGICFREQLGFWALIVSDHQVEWLGGTAS